MEKSLVGFDEGAGGVKTCWGRPHEELVSHEKLSMIGDDVENYVRSTGVSESFERDMVKDAVAKG